MKIINIGTLFLIVLLFSLNCFSKNLLQIQCWSGDHIYYNKLVKDAYLEDDALIIIENHSKIVIVGDCLIRRV